MRLLDTWKVSGTTTDAAKVSEPFHALGRAASGGDTLFAMRREWMLARAAEFMSMKDNFDLFFEGGVKAKKNDAVVFLVMFASFSFGAENQLWIWQEVRTLSQGLYTYMLETPAKFVQVNTPLIEAAAAQVRRLVPLQLDVLDGEHTVQRMRALALGPIAVAHVANEAAAADLVAGVVGAVEGRPLRDAELGLDEVEPRRIGRGEQGRHVEALEQSEQARMIMHVRQVVHHDVEPAPRVAGAEAAEGGHQVDHAFPLHEHAAEAVGMDVVEAQEVLDPVVAIVRRPHARRAGLGGPRRAAHGFQLERPPFVEADHRRARGAGAVDAADGFFLVLREFP